MGATPSDDNIGIAVLAAHAVVRAGLKYMLDNQSRLSIVGESSTVEDAVALALQVRPDVIVIDPDSDQVPLHVIADLSATGARVLVLTAASDVRIHERAFELGAVGVVSKDHSTETLVRAIEKVHAGEIWLERVKIARLLNVLLGQQDPEDAKIQSLTKREREVVALVGNGLKNAAIGDRLFISEATVRNHLTSILSKLYLTDRFELAVYAFRHGLVAFKAGEPARFPMVHLARGARVPPRGRVKRATPDISLVR